MVGNAQLLKCSRRVKASHRRIWVALVWMVAARLEAQGRNDNPSQREQCSAQTGRRGWRGPEDPERRGLASPGDGQKEERGVRGKVVGLQGVGGITKLG